MFILGDETRSNGKIPWVTFSLIGINVVVFAAQMLIGRNLTVGFSLIPAEITQARDLVKTEQVKVKVPHGYFRDAKGKLQRQYHERIVAVPQAPGPFPIFLTLITSMFLHGDLIHLVGNMWFLAIFGRNVECALDHGRFLAFYLACGVIGGLVYVASDASSVIPCLGASGAIAGVLGAYVSIHPLNMISLWFGIYIGVIKLPAFVVLGIWFLFQYIAAFSSLESQDTNLGGTAFWDHVGGFVAGIAIIWGMILYLKSKQAEETPEETEADEQKDPAAAVAAAPANDPFKDFMPDAPPPGKSAEEYDRLWR